MTASTFLRADATFAALVAGDVPAGVLKTNAGSFARDISLTSALGITGVGFTPKAVFFMSVGVSANKFGGIGFDNGAVSPSLDIDFTDAQLFQQTQQIIHKDVGNFNLFSITSMDADGFTLGWSKTGTPTGTATIYYLALG